MDQSGWAPCKWLPTSLYMITQKKPIFSNMHCQSSFHEIETFQHNVPTLQVLCKPLVITHNKNRLAFCHMVGKNLPGDRGAVWGRFFDDTGGVIVHGSNPQRFTNPFHLINPSHFPIPPSMYFHSLHVSLFKVKLHHCKNLREIEKYPNQTKLGKRQIYEHKEFVR